MHFETINLLQNFRYFTEARLFGETTLAPPILLWPFLAFPILLLLHFEVDLFCANFTKKNFFLLFSIFLIHKNYFFPKFFFFFFFSKIFCLFLINFFPLYIKNASSNTLLLFFLFDYSSNR